MYREVIETVSILLVISVWIHFYFYSKKDLKRVFLFFFGALFLGTVAEAVSMAVTESYHYDGFRWYIGSVPLFIAIGWCSSFYFSWYIANQITVSFQGTKGYLLKNALVAGMAGMFSDLFFDPVAVSLQWWTWEHGSFYFGVPISNFIGWFVFSGGFVCSFNYVDTKAWCLKKKYLLFSLLLLLTFLATALATVPFLKQ